MKKNMVNDLIFFFDDVLGFFIVEGYSFVVSNFWIIYSVLYV